MLRAGLAESLHPRVARAVLLAALVPAFLAFDEYFGLLAVDVGASLGVRPAAGRPHRRRPGRRRGARAAAAAAPPRPGRWSWPDCWWRPARPAARPLGFVAVAVGYGALQAAIVVAETDLQHRIQGRARATVTSVSGLLSELGAIGLYAFVALGSARRSTATLIAMLALWSRSAAWSPPGPTRRRGGSPTDSPGRS